MSVKYEFDDDEALKYRNGLEKELLGHQAAADFLTKKSAAIDSQLKGRVPAPDQADDAKSGKRKKGENSLAIQNYLASLGATAGATIADIHRATGVSYSSCRSTLQGKGEIFAKGKDDLWRLKPQI